MRSSRRDFPLEPETLSHMFIDSHCHVDFHSYDADRSDVLSRARAAGVGAMLEICGGDLERDSLTVGMRLVDERPEIYGAVGVHPHDAKRFDAALEERLRRLITHPKVLAWGEIGLDYYYDNSPRDVQRRAFIRQLELAREYDAPVILHIRDADADMTAILREYWSDRGARAGIFHCFSGSHALMEFGVELGFLISFSGSVTFKKSHDLRAVAAATPLDRLLIETDCPFLSPEPYRGKRNEPARVVEVARRLAEVRNLPVEEIGRVTTENFRRLFPAVAAAPPIAYDAE